MIAPRGPACDRSRGAGRFRHRAAELLPDLSHNMGNEGGQKSGISWTALAAFAANTPNAFAAYVRNPASHESSNADGRQLRLRRCDGRRAGILLSDILVAGQTMMLRMAKLLLGFRP